jgi:hypothetical protein
MDIEHGVTISGTIKTELTAAFFFLHTPHTSRVPLSQDNRTESGQPRLKRKEKTATKQARDASQQQATAKGDLFDKSTTT